MKQLYEEGDLLHNPFQSFLCTSERNSFPIAPHWHYYMELIYVLEGTLKVQVENDEYLVHSDEMILLHPKTVHAFYESGKAPVSMTGIKLDINSMKFTASYSPKLSNIFKAAEKKKESIFFDYHFCQDNQIGPFFKQMRQEIWDQKYGYDIFVFGFLYQLLILIVRQWQDNGFTIDNDVFREEETYDIFNILPYISDHLDADLKVTDIAASCGLSYSYFAKRFQAVYGKNCKEYIDDMRVHKAEELLLFTDFDLTYISQITGFSDCSHMIRCFKQRKNITPKQFRLMHFKNATSVTVQS